MIKLRFVKKLTLQNQLILVMSIALIIAAISFMIILPRILKPFYEQNTYQYLKQVCTFLKAGESSFKSEYAYIIKTRSGAVYISSNIQELFGLDYSSKAILENITGEYGKFSLNSNTYYYYVTVNNGVTNIALTDVKSIRLQETSLIGVIFPTMTATTLIIMILIYAWSNRVLVKIKRLRHKTEHFASSQYIEGESFVIDDELNMLSKVIDETRRNLKEKEEYKNHMFQNLSHELKTPIAVIDSYVEAIEDGMVEEQNGLRVIGEQTNKLKKQVETLLCFNKIDYLKEQLAVINSRIQIVQIISQSVDNYKMQRTDIEFILNENEKEVEFYGTVDMWQTVVDNILSNFLRYAKSKIIITIYDGRLEFFNDGEKIPEDMLEKIFSPYIKGNKGQTGLGLAIAKRITDIFKCDIYAQNLEEGIVFVIKNKE